MKDFIKEQIIYSAIFCIGYAFFIVSIFLFDYEDVDTTEALTLFSFVLGVILFIISFFFDYKKGIILLVLSLTCLAQILIFSEVISDFYSVAIVLCCLILFKLMLMLSLIVKKTLLQSCEKQLLIQFLVLAFGLAFTISSL